MDPSLVSTQAIMLGPDTAHPFSQEKGKNLRDDPSNPLILYTRRGEGKGLAQGHTAELRPSWGRGLSQALSCSDKPTRPRIAARDCLQEPGRVCHSSSGCPCFSYHLTDAAWLETSFSLPWKYKLCVSQLGSFCATKKPKTQGCHRHKLAPPL